ncbi:RNA-binding protein [Entomospira nematocerorum]|uniref:RNA-binding protein n=2 Tax=Entomospira TaxID=2834378 RepID=A0A968GDV4_9SPIO|nr:MULTISPECIES: RNA-binding protein [Entomospira]NIZ41086.1 RNA-binding protein [Entomospira entomophilus]NIZ46480.1 RNA-binding protein [Entomospira nematocera]WDI33719.1 RNA-binding protein [Entomospira nematocera]WDI35295.1 RNA-binding protein [Entomospira entomophilus]
MGSKVYVGNINYRTSDEALRQIFTEYGSVESVHLAKDRESGRFRGFAFIEMGSSEEASQAIRALDGQEIDGRQLRVKEAEDRPRPSRREF